MQRYAIKRQSLGVSRIAGFQPDLNRDPTDADPFRPGCQPHGVDGGDGRIGECFGHRCASEPAALFARLIREDGNLQRRLIHTREFQRRI